MNKHLETAVELARTSRCRYRHGAVVVYDGKVISQATNKKVGDPSKEWRRSHIHAEVAAAAAARSRVAGSTVYVARVLANGRPAHSRPCRKCLSYLRRAGVAKIIWT